MRSSKSIEWIDLQFEGPVVGSSNSTDNLSYNRMCSSDCESRILWFQVSQLEVRCNIISNKSARLEWRFSLALDDHIWFSQLCLKSVELKVVLNLIVKLCPFGDQSWLASLVIYHSNVIGGVWLTNSDWIKVVLKSERKCHLGDWIRGPGDQMLKLHGSIVTIHFSYCTNSTDLSTQFEE